MIRYKIYQNQQKKGLNAGKWFARAVSDETFDLAKLAEHMSKHNSPYSGGVIKGVLSDMVDCIKELLLDGKCVKIDDLAIFGVGIRSKAAETLEDFSLEKNITGMRLKARATGNLSTTNLKLEQSAEAASGISETNYPRWRFRFRPIRPIRIRAEAVKHLTRLPNSYSLVPVSPSFSEGLI